MHHELRTDETEVTTGPSHIDVDTVHEFLARSDRAECIPREIVEGSTEIGNPGIYREGT